MDEVLPLLRRLWAAEPVTWSGAGAGIGLDDFTLERVVLSPLPVQDPLEVWLGGMAPAALRRCGRLADGWLPSLCTPDTASAGREVIDAEATAAGRAISDEHFGVSLGYSSRPLTERTRTALASRARGADPDALVPVGWEATRSLMERFVAAGFSKFVLRPLDPPAEWAAELKAITAAVGDLQT
jgi:alkanesulfonate monooxygenase SsuD/methylene tetrahydromethanopterin reductase-like flavin-dependent oxidoreductase (luciferase family)